MAVNVNTVYRTVLLILNKEQRGMLTPDEFNKVATQVQLQIFQEYFNTLGIQVRRPDNVTEYGDQIKNTNADISVFKEYGECSYSTADQSFTLPVSSGATVYTQSFLGDGTTSQFQITSISSAQLADSIIKVLVDGQEVSTTTYQIANASLIFNIAPDAGDTVTITATPEDFYMLGSVLYKGTTNVQLVQRNELMYINSNPLTKPSETYPVFLYEANKIKVTPATIKNSIEASYLRKPLDVRWNFTVPAGQSYYRYNALGSTNFELSKVEQTNIISRILAYAGVVIRDPAVLQVAQAQVQQDIIKETL